MSTVHGAARGGRSEFLPLYLWISGNVDGSATPAPRYIIGTNVVLRFYSSSRSTRAQICRFCWHRIRTDENELCPACRKAYPENPADFTPLSQEQIAAFKAEKRQRDQQRRAKISENRKHLANVRVVQKNLVFVVGLPPRLADPEVSVCVCVRSGVVNTQLRA